MKTKIKKWKEHVEKAVENELLENETAVEDRILSFFVKTALGFDYESLDDVCCSRKSSNRQGEMPDYILFYGPKNEKRVVIEAKLRLSERGSKKKTSCLKQLTGYFDEMDTPNNYPRKIGILTDGIIYEFYSNIHNDKTNMDQEPFCVFNILTDELNEDIIELLSLLFRNGKEKFPHDEITEKVKELNSYRLFGLVFREMLLGNTKEQNLTDNLVKAFTDHRIFQDAGLAKVSKLGGTEKAKKILVKVIEDELDRYISQKMGSQSNQNVAEVYTPEEWRAYYIIAAILSESNLNLEDISMQRTSAYTLIYLNSGDDEKVRKRTGICRLKFLSNNKVDINFSYDGWENDTIKRLDTINSLFQYKDNLKKSLKKAQNS